MDQNFVEVKSIIFPEIVRPALHCFTRSFTFETMNKWFAIISFIGIALLLASCDDGDLQIETLDFDSVSAQTCESPVTTSTSLFFKINGDEVLILEMDSSLLINETGSRSSSFPSPSSLTYRIFDANVSSGYFCDAIPPVSPIVIEEIQATGGTVSVTTSTTDDITFTHLIQLDNVTLVNGVNERITDLSVNDFGTVTTTAN